jgi:glycine/D-amino acid oxidase-like deaminating enzyme
LKDGSWSFIIPRFFGGGTVIGGTKQPRDWNAEPEQSTREKLLEEGKKIAGLASGGKGRSDSIRVIADIVGRRPTREGGMRIEVEQVTFDRGQQRRNGNVVHAYGAGGRGYEISWGVAEEVAQLVKATLPGQEKGLRARL